MSDFHADAHDGSRAFFENRDPVFNAWLEDDPPPSR